VVGLFVSTDKKLGNVQGVNPYAYVGNNPETNNDPTGEMYAPPPVSGGNLPPSNNPPASTPWWQQVWKVTTKVINTALQFGNTITNLQLQLADFVFGFSSMGNDLRTLFNGNSSIGDKIWAGLDLGINAGTDIALLFGVGELIRGGELAIKGGDLAFKAGEDILQHGGEEAISHVGETLLDDGKSLVGDFCSFTASTAVMTAVGKQAIGSLHVGEKVLAYNSKTHKMELQPILHVWIDKDNDLVDLTLTTVHRTQQGRGVSRQSEVIHTNKKHPFLTKEKGFLPVGQIKLGMHVLRADGQWGIVTGWKVVAGAMTMYNLEVAQDHTFTVGAGEWVVHNCDPNQLVNQTARNYAQRMFNAFRDHLTPSDLEGAWRDLHGNPVPNPNIPGTFYDHYNEVQDALQSGKNAIVRFTDLLEGGTLSDTDSCIIQCLISRASKTIDYTEKIISRDQWFPGTKIPFP
jgi:hypothetical protein